MSKPSLSFEDLCDLVIAGRCEVESGEDVSEGAEAPDSVLAVLMHRDVPGAVALYGFIGQRGALSVCYSDVLWSFLAVRFAKEYEFRCKRSPMDSCLYIGDAVLSLAKGKRDERVDGLLLVARDDGALDVLRALKRECVLARAGEVLGSERLQ